MISNTSCPSQNIPDQWCWAPKPVDINNFSRDINEPFVASLLHNQLIRKKRRQIFRLHRLEGFWMQRWRRFYGKICNKIVPLLWNLFCLESGNRTCSYSQSISGIRSLLHLQCLWCKTGKPLLIA